MAILAIDQGNSSAKVSLWTDGEIVENRRFEILTIEDLLPFIAENNVEGCIYCSVKHTDARFLESLRQAVEGRLVVLTSSVKLPFDIHYSKETPLGADRIAAIAGAAVLEKGKGALVVDMGTAMTLDVVDRDGNFMGGNISPGLRLRFESLASADKLPQLTAAGEISDFGDDTSSAIRDGVVMGMAAEVIDSFERAIKDFGVSSLILTGNDAKIVAEVLKKRNISFIYDKDLVGRGLNMIYQALR